jgi:hypothetical protein
MGRALGLMQKYSCWFVTRPFLPSSDGCAPVPNAIIARLKAPNNFF